MAAKVNNSPKILTIFQVVFEVLYILVKLFYLVAIETFYLFKERAQKSVEGDIVLVTGAGHGIGKELAKQYASLGATVVCWDINKRNNDETVNEIKELGYSNAHAYVCNVTNQKEVQKVAERVKIEVGCVTILINNAGVAYVKNLLETDASEIENTINVNMLSHFWTIKAFLPGMINRNQGHIVTISSIAGLYGSQNGTAYCSSKFGVRGMTEALFLELRTNPNNKIYVTTIYPSGVNTGIFKKARTRFRSFLPIISPQEAAQQIIKAQRQNRLEYSMPGYNLTIHSLARMLPARVLDKLQDFFDICVIE